MKRVQKKLFLCIFILGIALLVFLIALSIKLSEHTTQMTREAIVKEAQNIALLCQKSKNPVLCYQDAFTTFTKLHGFNNATQTLAQLQKIDDKAKTCHVIAHKIAIAAISQNPSKWNDILANINPYACGYGYMHGALEGKAQIDPSFVLNAKTVQAVCKEISDQYSSSAMYNSCTHIMGHILLAQTLGNIPNAIDVCKGLGTDQAQINCSAGVFMESFTRSNLAVHGIAKREKWTKETADKQEVLCRSYSGNAAVGCWAEISYLYNALHPYKPQMIFNDCSRAPTVTYRDDCYFHAITSILLNTKSANNSPYMISLCKPYETLTAYTYCISKVINGYMKSTPSRKDNAEKYCSLLDDPYKKDCKNDIAGLVNTTNGTNEDTLCNQKENDSNTFCTQ